MICYKDMTFCGYYETCKDGKECFRSLDKVPDDTELLVMQFRNKPKCWEAHEEA